MWYTHVYTNYKRKMASTLWALMQQRIILKSMHSCKPRKRVSFNTTLSSCSVYNDLSARANLVCNELCKTNDSCGCHRIGIGAHNYIASAFFFLHHIFYVVFFFAIHSTFWHVQSNCINAKCQWTQANTHLITAFISNLNTLDVWSASMYKNPGHTQICWPT